MRFCALSDIHGNLIDNIDPCDVVLIAGDIFPLDIQSTTVKASVWLCQKFIPWAESLPCDKVVFIAGNHDFLFEQLPESEIMDVLPRKIVYLEDEIYDYHGVKIFGTPWCMNEKWAFYTDDESEYKEIPKCDILVTHQPPMLGSVGVIHQPGWNYMKTFASKELANRIKEIKPKFVVCGHVHSGNHVAEEINGTTIINVSILDEDYKIAYEPTYFDLFCYIQPLGTKIENVSKSKIKLEMQTPEDNNLYDKVLP